jgi:AhpD family alkylhydroperoxidase
LNAFLNRRHDWTLSRNVVALNQKSATARKSAWHGSRFCRRFVFGTDDPPHSTLARADDPEDICMSEASAQAAIQELIHPARVPLREREQVTPELVPLYDKLLVDRGCIPNMFKALANVPALALGIAALLKPLMGDGALPAWYKELIATRVAALNDCEYCISAHRYSALQRGATPEQIASVDGDAAANQFETGPFTEKEKAAAMPAFCTSQATPSTKRLSLQSARTSRPMS